ncbi:MAG: hypothetical protein PHT07_23220 [Paludibacter sp.]|nr:hypothetical protein [Paludibacter sp.]
MTFEILSEKRKKLKTRIVLLYLIIFISAMVISILTDNLFAKYVFIGLFLLILTPVFLLGDKTIGEFELNDSFIRFTTQQGEMVKLKLSDVTSCKIEYTTYKGNVKYKLRGWSWETGINEFKIEAKEKNYNIPFISTSMKDQDKIYLYIDVLKRNGISYNITMNGRTFTSEI